ncbi:hypothetical protein XENOCAPTIV_018171 [Xenoophorus captivus]|uniref:C-type lectin domain-containing protein n=1 Tax=Xenoophorus captivus TaxID=1517983 RepID=A0ABV0QSG2_9TELE
MQGVLFASPIGRSNIYQLIGVSFFLLCITQAALNVYLWHECEKKNKELEDRVVEKENQISELQKRINTEKKNKELEDRIVEKENQISELQKRINSVELNSLECPLGWQRFMSSCYQLSTETNTWTHAKQNCESKGARLMILNDETEQRPFIGGVVKIWIGLYGQTENNTSFWYLKGVDGRLLKYG